MGLTTVDNNTIISEHTIFEGEISAEHITIEGKVVGDIKALSSILIKESGWVEGDINAPTIYLAKGCHHEGAIYIDHIENSSSPKINMNEIQFDSDNSNEMKTKEVKILKEQPVSSRPKSKLW